MNLNTRYMQIALGSVKQEIFDIEEIVSKLKRNNKVLFSKCDPNDITTECNFNQLNNQRDLIRMYKRRIAKLAITSKYLKDVLRGKI